MIKIENYPNAYKEVFVILNNVKKEDLELIPESFINMIKNNMNNDYEFELDGNKEFENQNLLKETKAILAYIFLNYWGTSKQNAVITKKLRQDIIKEEHKKVKYNVNEILKNRQSEIIIKNETQNEEVQILQYKKENILVRLINKIKSIFKRK